MKQVSTLASVFAVKIEEVVKEIRELAVVALQGGRQCMHSMGGNRPVGSSPERSESLHS